MRDAEPKICVRPTLRNQVNDHLSNILETHSIPKEQSSGPLWQLWPFWLYVVVAGVVDLGFVPILNTLISSKQDIAGVFVFGSMVGQACFVCLIGSLFGRTWLGGYVFAVVLASTGVYLFALGENLYHHFRYGLEYSWSAGLAPSLLAPAFVLAGATPLLVFRGRFDWRLTRLRELGYKPQRWGVEELLIGTAVTAASLIVATSAEEIAQMTQFQFLLPLGIVCSMVASVSLLGVAPAVWVCFRITSWRRRLKLMGMLVGIVVFLTMSISLAVNAIGQKLSSRFFSIWTEVLFFSAATSIVSAIVFLTGLVALMASGYRLFQSIPECVASTKPIDANPSPLVDDELSNEGHLGYSRFMHRAFAGLILGFALIVSIATSNLKQSRVDRLTKFQDQARELGEKGVLHLDANSEPVELKVSPDTSLDELIKNERLQRIGTLSLANCRFGDEDVRKLSKFTELHSLDLEGTQITDIGLLTLAEIRPISRIGLARTKVTSLGLQTYIEKASMAVYIDLRESAIDCDQLAESTAIKRIFGLRLGKAQVNNTGLAKLLAVANLTELDLTDCDVDETAFQNTDTPHNAKLVLDGTLMSDVPFIALLSSLHCSKLSINRTALTDKILPSLALATGVDGLQLSETHITERGLANAQIQHLTRLSLNGKQFTGECFSAWRPSLLNSLDLSNSGVTDQTLAKVVSLPSLALLNLANTGITDAGLALIAKTKIYAIDVRGTKVTAAGLCDSKISGKKIFLDINQFTSEEVRRIRKNSEVYLGPEFPW